MREEEAVTLRCVSVHGSTLTLCPKSVLLVSAENCVSRQLRRASTEGIGTFGTGRAPHEDTRLRAPCRAQGLGRALNLVAACFSATGSTRGSARSYCAIFGSGSRPRNSGSSYP
jgi:hypothetical protein